MEMNLDKICLILRIEINFGSCDRLNLVFWKFDEYVRVKLNENENEFWRRSLILVIKFGKAKMDLEIW